MRRNASSLLVKVGFPVASLSILVIVAGCAGKKKTDAQTYQPRFDSYSVAERDRPEQGFQPASDLYPTYGPATPTESSYDAVSGEGGISEPATSAEPRYHVVQKKDTLYGLARTYYGDASRWKDIYNANRSVIGNPNMIMVGQRLELP